MTYSFNRSNTRRDFFGYSVFWSCDLTHESEAETHDLL